MTTKKQRELAALRTVAEAFQAKWKRLGRKLSTWVCPHCQATLNCCVPTRELGGPRGLWDSATQCANCGWVSFLTTYTDGRTEVTQLPA